MTLGELSPNDRHESSMSPSFAVRWFEVDPAYQVARLEPAAAPAEGATVVSGRWCLKRRIVKKPRIGEIGLYIIMVPRLVFWYRMTLARRSWTLAQRNR